MKKPSCLRNCVCWFQTLTYGISINWQEPYLKPLLQSLCACAKNPDAKEATLALSTVVNLLHRNAAAAGAFLRCVPPKEFLKQLITSRETKSLEFRLEVSYASLWRWNWVLLVILGGWGDGPLAGTFGFVNCVFVCRFANLWFSWQI